MVSAAERPLLFPLLFMKFYLFHERTPSSKRANRKGFPNTSVKKAE
jgi:hypothetical protein